MATPQEELNLTGAEPLPRLNLRGAEPLARRRAPSKPRPLVAPPPPVSAPSSEPAPAFSRPPRVKAGVNLEGVNPALVGFAAARDFTITSGRDAARVHVPGSRHGDGTAVDLRTRDKSPEEVARAMQEARAAGFGVRDERYGSGTGPHIHLTAPAGGGLNLEGAEPLGGEEVGDVVTVNTSMTATTLAPAPLVRREAFDPRTTEGRAVRDRRNTLERAPGAFLEVAAPLPSEDRLSDPSAGAEMVKAAYVRALAERGVPEAEAARLVGSGYSLKNAKGERVAPADAITDDALDASARSLRVRLDAGHVSKLVDTYKGGRGVLSRAADWAGDETRSPGEKVLDVAGAPVGVAAKGAELARRATKPLDMFGARMWTRLGGGTAEQARAASDAVWNDEPLPAYAENFVAEDIERDMSLLNPRVGKAYGALARMLTDPTNFIPAGGVVKIADKFADGVRALRAARGAEEVAAAVVKVERVVTEAAELSKAAKLGAVDVERLAYARERAAHYAAEAEGAKSRGARQVARELADDYAAEVRHLESPAVTPSEGYDLTGAEPLAPHHSAAQPRASGGQFDGAPLSVPRRAAAVAGDAADALKSNLYSADVSAPFRQALFPLMFETRATMKGLAEGLPSVLPSRHAQFVGRMRALPVAKEADEMGLALSSINPAAKSDYFPSAAASRLPWVGASERVMEAQLDAVRLNVYESLAGELRAAGLTPKTAPEEFRGVAHMVNVSSGHGTTGRLLSTKTAGKVLGSPKLLKSRFQVLNPVEYARLPPRARRIALRKAGRTAAVFSGLFGLAYMTADEVGLDPRAPNFGTARFGETSYDLTGGEANKIRFIVNLVRSVHDTARVARSGGSIKYEETPIGVAGRFLRSQLSPAASLPVDAAVGEDFNGREFTWSEAAIRRAAPLMVQDLWDGYSSGGAVGSLKSLPAFVGISTRQLDPEKLKRQVQAAINRTVPVELTEAARGELDRLGVDLKKLKADAVRPGFKVTGVDGEAVTPMSKDDPSGLAQIAPDDTARDLAEEISAAVEAAVSSPDYGSFDSDAGRAKYLTQVVRNARARVYAGLRLRARENQMQDLRRIEEYQRRLEDRSRQRRRGPQTLNLDGVRESENVEDRRGGRRRFKL